MVVGRGRACDYIDIYMRGMGKIVLTAQPHPRFGSVTLHGEVMNEMGGSVLDIASDNCPSPFPCDNLANKPTVALSV